MLVQFQMPIFQSITNYPFILQKKYSPLDRKYVGTEAWCPMEVIRDQGVPTSKADIFAFGLLVYEMLSLHSPHIDMLFCNDDSGDEDNDDSVDEEAFRAALGTRPLLPDSFQFDQSYRGVLEIFFTATDEDPDQRPSAREILDLMAAYETGEDNDDSILCVNMVKGAKESLNSVAEQRSVICIDDSVTED